MDLESKNPEEDLSLDFNSKIKFRKYKESEIQYDYLDKHSNQIALGQRRQFYQNQKNRSSFNSRKNTDESAFGLSASKLFSSLYDDEMNEAYCSDDEVDDSKFTIPIHKYQEF